MPVITLTTEWRPEDIYHGIIKGKLCSLCPGVMIIDNATGIPPFNIAHAAFVIRNTFINYPKGSVHLVFVHSEALKGQDYLIVKAREHFFIGTDNGIFNLILNSEPEEMVMIGHSAITDETEIFARAAAGLLEGKTPGELGKPLKSISERIPLRATIEKDVITGSIIFIDSYGNAISNITREVFSRVFDEREYRILIQSNKDYTDRIIERYSDVPVGDMLARFNSLDLLEIAINGANVSELLSLNVGSVVRIEQRVRITSPNHLF
jgi:S-adenosylmethionine hydrolase